jgi:hypothetical protein
MSAVASIRALLASECGCATDTGGIRGAVGTQTRKATTFSVTPPQASEIAAVVGFLRAYNPRHLKAALRYFYFPKKLGQLEVDGASDCDYRRRTTKVYEHRTSVVRWLGGRSLAVLS